MYRESGWIIIIFIIFICGTSCRKSGEVFGQENIPDASVEHPLDGNTYKILFIGSSYFSFNDLPELFINLAQNQGKELIVEASIRNGTFLEYHSTNVDTEDKINAEQWDFVILQGGGTIVAYPDTYAHFELLPVLNILYNKIHRNCENSEMVFCMPWAFEDGMTWVEGETDDFFDMQQHIYDNTLAYADRLDMIVSPIGWAWNEIMKENPPLHYLYLSDYNHPSIRGSYLTACVLYATLFKETVTDIQFYSTLPEKEAIHLQEVASEIVLENYEIWE